MTEEQIQRVEKELLDNYVNKPLAVEEQIQDIAKSVAGQLVFAPQRGLSYFNFLGDDFVVRSKEGFEGNKRQLYFVISNEHTRATAGNRYIPYQVNCEVDNDLSILENYKAAIEGFLRHLIGNDQATEVS